MSYIEKTRAMISIFYSILEGRWGGNVGAPRFCCSSSSTVGGLVCRFIGRFSPTEEGKFTSRH